MRVRESQGDLGEHPPCLLPPSPAPHGWAPGATMDASAIRASYPSACCPQSGQAHQRPWVLGPARGRGEPGLPAATATALSLAPRSGPSAPSPAPKVGSVRVQGKSTPLGEGLKLSRAKPCPGGLAASAGSTMTQETQFLSWARAGPRARWLWAGRWHHCPSCRSGPYAQVLSSTTRPEVCLRKPATVQFTLNVQCLSNTEISTFRGTRHLGMTDLVTST